MSSTLFRLDKKFSVVLDEDAMNLDPSLRLLNAKQKLFLVLYVDYRGPYNQLPEQDRLRKAKRQAFGTDDCTPEKEKKIIDAMDAYGGLQFDYRREKRDQNLARADKLSAEMLKEDDPKKIPAMQAAINIFEANAKKYQDEIDAVEDSDYYEIKGDESGRLSKIEMWQKNRAEKQKNLQRELQKEKTK